MKKPFTPDPIAEIKSEILDYERQIAEAQRELVGWNQRALMAQGALQACQALLKKMEIQDVTPTPTAP